MRHAKYAEWGGARIGTGNRVGLHHVSRKIGLLMFVCYSRSVCNSVRDCADVISCLREPGAQSYANTHVDRQIGKPIKTLGPSILIGRTFLGPTPSKEYINTFRLLNLIIAIGM